MKKRDKEKKEKKPKKSLRQAMSSLNVTKDVEHGNVVLNPKDKRVKWFFIFGILAVVATGISVPWALSYRSVKEKVGREDSNKLLNDENLNFGELENSLNAYSNEQIKAYSKEYQDLITQYLYIQERNAFLKFKAFLENTKYKDDKTKFAASNYGADLSTPFADVKNKISNKFYDEKKAYKAQNPDWTKSWRKMLLTDEKYGKPLGDNVNPDKPGESIEYIEKKVINYLLAQELKAAAFARYSSADIKYDIWKFEDLDLKLEQDINFDEATPEVIINEDGSWEIKEKLNKNGATLTVKASVDYWKQYLNKAKIGQVGSNIFYEGNLDKKATISVFETKSYVPEFRNPINAFASIFSKSYKAANISKLSLGFGLDKQVWTFTKDVFIKLFSKYEYYDYTSGKTETRLVIQGLQNYQGTNTILSGSLSDEQARTQLNQDYALNKILGASTSTEESDTAKKAKKPEQAKQKQTRDDSTTTTNSVGGTKTAKTSELLKSDNTDREFHLFALSSGDYVAGANSDEKLFDVGIVANKNSTNVTTQNNVFDKMIDILFQKDTIDNTKYSFLERSWLNSSSKEVMASILSLIVTNSTINGSISSNLSPANYNSNLSSLMSNILEEDFKSAFTSTNNISNEKQKNPRGLLPQSFNDSKQNDKPEFKIENAQTLGMNDPTYWPITVSRAWTINKLSTNTYLFLGKTNSYVYSIKRADETNIKKMILQAIKANFYTNTSVSLPFLSDQPYLKEDFFGIKDLYASINSDSIINSVIYSNPKKDPSVAQSAQKDSDYSHINWYWFEILKKRFSKSSSTTGYQEFYNQIKKYIKDKTAADIFKANIEATKTLYSGDSNLIDSIINDKNSYDFIRKYMAGINTDGTINYQEAYNSYSYIEINNGLSFDEGRGSKEEQLRQQFAQKVLAILNPEKPKEEGVN